MTKAPGINEVYSHVNRLAHQLALREEMRLRSEILAQVQEARGKGADTNELLVLVQKIARLKLEAGPVG